MYGSETMPKDVLEYVVFEKHLSNQYGVWRLHGKIVPEWMPTRDAALRTFLMPSFKEPEEETEDTKEEDIEDQTKLAGSEPSSKLQPQPDIV